MGKQTLGEQLCKKWARVSPAMSRWYKKFARRKRRNQWKWLGEDAPKKNKYSGWSD